MYDAYGNIGIAISDYNNGNFDEFQIIMKGNQISKGKTYQRFTNESDSNKNKLENDKLVVVTIAPYTAPTKVVTKKKIVKVKK